MRKTTGTVIGYDPGGKRGNGLCRLFIKDGSIYDGNTMTLDNSEQIIQNIQNESSVLAVGVDTLTSWSTGEGGWRPADRWLRGKYKEVKNSILSPNSLYGSMALNGMAVLLSLRAQRPDLFITETHPKVLFWCLMREKYDYKNKKKVMDKTLRNKLGFEIKSANSHEWDSAISAFIALQGLMGIWKHDLHKMPCTVGERLINPCGETHYFWPE